MRSDRYRDWDSAYVLGALSVEERLEFERHLENCEVCARSVNDLAGMPGILGRIDAEDALAVRDRREETEETAEFDDARVLRGLARRERTLRRRRFAGFAAACAMCLGLGAGGAAAVLGGSGPGTGGGARPETVAMEPVGASGMRADVSVVAKPWGTRLEWSCSYRASYPGGPEPRGSYELVVTDKRGAQTVVATWKAAGPSARHLAASSRQQADDIRSVDIRRAGSDQPLARTSL